MKSLDRPTEIVWDVLSIRDLFEYCTGELRNFVAAEIVFPIKYGVVARVMYRNRVRVRHFLAAVL